MGLKATEQNLDKESLFVSCWRNYTAAATATPERTTAKKETPLSGLVQRF